MLIRRWTIAWLASVLFIVLSLQTQYANSAAAQDSFKGSGTASYSWTLDKKERLEAERKAKQNAVENWVATVHPKHIKNYDSIRDKINENIDDYILNHTVIDTVKQSDTNTVKVVIRAKLNEQRLLNELIDSNRPDSDGEFGDYIAFVFVAREYAGTETNTYKEATKEKSQTKGIGKQKVDDQASLTKSQQQKIAVATRKVDAADTTLWRVFQTNEINTAMGGVLTDAEYAVVDAGFLEEETGGLFDVESFIRDYENGDDISPQTKRDALKGLKSLNEDPVRYLAIGTLDIDKITQDPVSGLPRVAISTTGQVLDVNRRGAAVAKVGPVVYSGMGDTEFVAKNNALKKAAEEVAAELVARLVSRKIR